MVFRISRPPITRIVRDICMPQRDVRWTIPAFSRCYSITSRSVERISLEKEFDEQYTYAMDRLGPSPSQTHPLVRENVIRRLLRCSRDETQLKKITDLLIEWRNKGKKVDRKTALEFIDRCLAWNPSLLVEILSDRPKYGLDIPDISEARRILRKLIFSRSHPHVQPVDETERRAANAETLKLAVTFTALYPAYRLPLATSDLTSCALLAQACSLDLPEEERSRSQNALTTLIPKLANKLQARKAVLQKGQHSDLENAGTAVLSRRESGFTQSEATEWKWVQSALVDVRRALQRLEGMKSVQKELLTSQLILS